MPTVVRDILYGWARGFVGVALAKALVIVGYHFTFLRVLKPNKEYKFIILIVPTMNQRQGHSAARAWV